MKDGVWESSGDPIEHYRRPVDKDAIVIRWSACALICLLIIMVLS